MHPGWTVDELPSGEVGAVVLDDDQDDALLQFHASAAPSDPGEPPESEEHTESPAPALNGHQGYERPLSAEQAYQPYREAGGPAAWPEPLDLNAALFRGLPLPMDLVPESLRVLIEDCAERTGIDAGAFFTGFLGAASGLANDFIRLQPKQNDHTWTVRPVVWPLAIGGSSSGKSPALEEGMRFVQRKDAAAVLENTRKMKDHEHAMAIYADDCAAARKNKGPRPPEPDAPALREYWVSRGTSEGITRLLQHSPKVTLYLDEISGLINSMDRYAAGGKGSGDREFYLMLWNGGAGKNTLAGKTTTLPNASAVICGGTTPSAMVKSAGGKLQNDGFLQRTMLVMVPKRGDGADTVPDARAIEGYDRMLDNLLGMLPATVLLAADAQPIYNDFRTKVGALIDREENESLAAHLGKWDGLAARLMLLYFLIDCAHHGQLVADGARVPASIARQVCSLLMDWQLSHLQHFWHEMMADKSSRRFTLIISRYILANPGLAELNFRDHVARPHWREVEKLKPWDIKDALNTLTSAAWLSPIDGKPNSYGVAAKYSINPKIAGLFERQRQQEMEMRGMRYEEMQRMRAPAVGFEED